MLPLPKFDESSANACFYSFVSSAVLSNSLNALSSIFETPLNAYSLVYPTKSIPQNVRPESVNLNASDTPLRFSKFRDGSKIYYKAIDLFVQYDCLLFNEYSYLVIKVGTMVAFVYFSLDRSQKKFELEIANPNWEKLKEFFLSWYDFCSVKCCW